MTAPVEYGGGGLSYFDALLAVEEMARYDPRSAAEMHTNGTGTASHLWVLGHARAAGALAAADLRRTHALCDRDDRAGGRLGGDRDDHDRDCRLTTATAYCLNGGKIFISGGKHADVFVTYARFGTEQRGR